MKQAVQSAGGGDIWVVDLQRDGGRPAEKDPPHADTSPAAYPTRRGPSEKDQLSWHLANGLPCK